MRRKARAVRQKPHMLLRWARHKYLCMLEGCQYIMLLSIFETLHAIGHTCHYITAELWGAATRHYAAWWDTLFSHVTPLLLLPPSDVFAMHACHYCHYYYCRRHYCAIIIYWALPLFIAYAITPLRHYFQPHWHTTLRFHYAAAEDIILSLRQRQYATLHLFHFHYAINTWRRYAAATLRWHTPLLSLRDTQRYATPLRHYAAITPFFIFISNTTPRRIYHYEITPFSLSDSSAWRKTEDATYALLPFIIVYLRILLLSPPSPPLFHCFSFHFIYRRRRHAAAERHIFIIPWLFSQRLRHDAERHDDLFMPLRVYAILLIFSYILLYYIFIAVAFFIASEHAASLFCASDLSRCRCRHCQRHQPRCRADYLLSARAIMLMPPRCWYYATPRHYYRCRRAAFIMPRYRRYAMTLFPPHYFSPFLSLYAWIFLFYWWYYIDNLFSFDLLLMIL